MPGFIVHQGAMIMCTHAGTAQPIGVEPRVKVGGLPVLTLATTHAIAGCGLTGTAVPCTTGKWIVAATRVKANGIPVIIVGSQGLCPPSGKLEIISTQTQVSAT